jgi:hypothetical protein
VYIVFTKNTVTVVVTPKQYRKVIS